jgi:hypothetical protein
MTTPPQAGGTTLSFSFSNRLAVRPMRPCETWVAHRGRQVRVAEQHLDHADVDAALQQMGGEAVP